MYVNDMIFNQTYRRLKDSAPPNSCPDGSIVTDQTKLERWGVAYNRYHSMDIVYFMSSLSSAVANNVAQNYLWKNSLSTTPIQDKEYRDRLPERLHGAVEKLEGAGSTRLGVGFVPALAASSGAEEASGGGAPQSMLHKASQAVGEISTEQLHGLTSQSVKRALFGQ